MPLYRRPEGVFGRRLCIGHCCRLSELGVELVDRSSGGLTEEGEAAVARARRIQAELDALESDVAALRDVVVGTVRVGIISSISRWLVPSLLSAMHERHPQVAVIIVDASTTSLLPQLLDGSLEVVHEPAEGEAVVLRTLDTGAVVGELASTDGRARSATVRAVTPCRLLKIPAPDFRNLLRRRPDILEELYWMQV